MGNERDNRRENTRSKQNRETEKLLTCGRRKKERKRDIKKEQTLHDSLVPLSVSHQQGSSFAVHRIGRIGIREKLWQENLEHVDKIWREKREK